MSEDQTVYTGTVIWFKGNLGFIEWAKNNTPQADMFVYYSDIDMDGFKKLLKGQKVSFQIGENHKGQPKAICVKVLA